MNKESIKKIKQKLLNEREKLLKMENNGTISKEDTVDSIDFANAQDRQNVVSFISFKNKRTLQKIESALKKIESPGYGSCEDCGDNISEKRLIANPNSLICIDCQEDHELENRKFKHSA